MKKLFLAVLLGIFLGFAFSDVIESYIYYNLFSTKLGYAIIKLHHSTAGDIYWKVDHLISDNHFWMIYPGDEQYVRLWRRVGEEK
jgi:hypothetical protein